MNSDTKKARKRRPEINPAVSLMVEDYVAQNPHKDFTEAVHDLIVIGVTRWRQTKPHTTPRG